MAKPLYVYTGTDWVPVASELESTSQYATTTYVDNKVGLDYLHTETFSAVSTVSINNVFSSDYDNYRIIVGGSLSASATGGTINLRLRTSGTDNSAAAYNVLGVSAPSVGYNVASQTSAIVGYPPYNSTNSNWGSLSLDLIKPNAAQWTHFYSVSQGVNGSGQDAWLSIGGNHRVATSYDGFSLIYPAAATGILRVYGVKN